MTGIIDQFRRLAPAATKTWYRNRRRRAALEAIRRKSQIPVRIYVGCGYVRFDGWVHLDRDNAAKPDLVWDVGWGLPLEDNSADAIYSEHFLEHLPLDVAKTFLSECHRCLRDGGTLRTAMPSLEALLEARKKTDWKSEFEFLQWPHYAGVKTHAELMNIVFRHFQHAWIYDLEELRRRLADAGFSTIREASWGQSEVDCLAGLETRSDSRLICEAQK